MRLFVAIKLPNMVDQSLLDTMTEWKEHGVSGTWTKSVNFHITLAFLGEQPESSLPVITKILQELPFPAMKLKTAGTGNFKDLYYARITNLENEESKPLINYVHQLRNALMEAGIALDHRFKAHVTIARRLKNPNHYALHIPAQVFDVNQVCLYQSVLSPQGPAYTILARFPAVSK